MSKKYIVIIIVAICLAAAFSGGNAYFDYEYKRVDASEVPVTPITVAKQPVLPISAEFSMPLFANAQVKFPMIMNAIRSKFEERLEKQLSCVQEDGVWLSSSNAAIKNESDDYGLLGEAPYSFEFELPDVMYWSAVLSYIDNAGTETPIFVEGGAKPEIPVGMSDTVTILKAGEYIFSAEGTLNKTGPEMPSGTVRYRVQFSVKNPDPIFEAGRAELAQGEIFSLRLENIPKGIVPELETELGPVVFTKGLPQKEQEIIQPEGFENWYAMIPISNTRAVGDYIVSVFAGELAYETTVTVTEYEFPFQNLIIDTSVPSVAAATTAQANQEFRDKMVPLYSVFSEERYWDGMFAWPIEMEEEDYISTEFGEIRITNGNQNTRRSHNGVDIAASTGTPVYAAGAGRVLLAEFLLSVGNTVVIDHGGGLIGIYYHMDSVDTIVDKIVERGELIGTVGSTGYSTGPHLHFEMRIGEQPISPSMLQEPTAGLYSAQR